MKSELGLGPVHHYKEDWAEEHLSLTVLAYQAAARDLHVRKTTVAKPKLQSIYNALFLSESSMGINKLVS